MSSGIFPRTRARVQYRRMAEQNTGGSKGRPRGSSADIGPILSRWKHHPGTLNVREIMGRDGRVKIQMRLDLGLLQMETSGRPDGARPHGCESLLHYHCKRLRRHIEQTGSEEGFRLTRQECQALRDEAMMYYHRYVSLFVLEQYAGVVRDTQRNLAVLDLCSKYAASEEDRMILEQYRPYILMMNTRARASIECRRSDWRKAYRIVRRGLKRIKQFFDDVGHPEAFAEARESRVLRRFAREIRRHLPVNPLRELQRRLDEAVREERYEEAARLRDEIERLKSQPRT